MTNKPLLPALVQERLPLQPLATVSVLNDLQALVRPIRTVLAHLTHEEAHALDGLVQRTGRAEVFSGDPADAHQLNQKLRRAGLTTSLNWRVQKEAISD